MHSSLNEDQLAAARRREVQRVNVRATAAPMHLLPRARRREREDPPLVSSEAAAGGTEPNYAEAPSPGGATLQAFVQKMPTPIW